MTPDEFKHALTNEGAPFQTSVAGARVAFRRWPKVGAQGVLLIHGHAAHARWWDHLAPALNTVFDVSAIDLSGSGDSDHRDFYSSSLFATEMMQVSLEAGYAAPIVIAHSFGGTLARMACYLNPGWAQKLILIDSVISSAPSSSKKPALSKPPNDKRSAGSDRTLRKLQRRYKSPEAALRRFRVRPRQSIEHGHIERHVARHSIKRIGDDYQFKFDRDLLKKFLATPGLPRGSEMIQGIEANICFVYGQRSQFFTSETLMGRQNLETITDLIAPDRIIAIEDAAHHVFLDQPNATIEALLSLASR